MLKILSWNVNGIRAVEGKGFLAFLAASGCDVLCLQETKARPDQLGKQLTAPQGFFTYWNYPARRGYAGVSVFTRKRSLSVETDFLDPSFDTEGRALILHYKNFILINVYFPNGGSGPERLKYKLEFYDRFLVFADSIKKRDIIICGDFNTAHKAIDLARPGQNEMSSGFLPVERAWLDKFTGHGYHDTFRAFNNEPGQYTWWDYKTRSRERNVGWRIDYFFAAGEIMPEIKSAFIMPEITGSDHCPVGIELDVKW
ncbi:MAG: exodeoxyribonuclease III [Candidatus Omnitrophota bacterium]